LQAKTHKLREIGTRTEALKILRQIHKSLTTQKSLPDEEYIESLLKAWPDIDIGWVSLIRVKCRSGKIKDAVDTLNRAISHIPGSRNLHAIQSERWYLKAIQRDPSNSHARRKLIKIRNKLKSSESLPDEREVRDLLAEQPNLLIAWLTLLNLQRKKGEFRNALETAEQAESLFPTSVQIIRQKTEIVEALTLQRVRRRFAEGKRSTALTILNRHLSKKPSSKAFRQTIVSILVNHEDYDSARKHVNIGLKFNPDDPRLLYYKSSILYRQRQYRQAIQCVRNAGLSDPSIETKKTFILLSSYELLDQHKSLIQAYKALDIDAFPASDRADILDIVIRAARVTGQTEILEDSTAKWKSALAEITPGTLKKSLKSQNKTAPALNGLLHWIKKRPAHRQEDLEQWLLKIAWGKRMYRDLSYYMSLDQHKFHADLDNLVIGSPFDRIAEIRDNGKGLLIVGSHLGPTPALINGIIMRHWPFKLVSENTPFVDQENQISVRDGQSGAVKEILRAIQQNSIVLMAGDVPSVTLDSTDFISRDGRDFYFTTFPAKLAYKFNVPVLIANPEWRGDKIRIKFGNLRRPRPDEDMGTYIDEYLEKFLNMVLSIIDGYPENLSPDPSWAKPTRLIGNFKIKMNANTV